MNPLHPFLFETDILSISLDLFGIPPDTLYFLMIFPSIPNNYFTGMLQLPQLIDRGLLPSFSLLEIVTINSIKINIFSYFLISYCPNFINTLLKFLENVHKSSISESN